MLVAGCVRGVTPPPASHRPEVHIPPGCERDLSGAYVHARVEQFRYLASDDGGTLTLALARAQDAGAVLDGGTVLELSRTADGFLGEARTEAPHVSGTACPVSFPTRVVACEQDGLRIQSAAVIAIDAACRPTAAEPEMTEHQLRRVALANGDGGS
jgi:hypothetical protein